MTSPDPYELEVLQAYERGELKPVATKAEWAKFRSAARATAIKDKRVNICLSSSGLREIQVKALEEGLPYQTLIASVLHKYVTGKLAEAKAEAPGKQSRAGWRSPCRLRKGAPSPSRVSRHRRHRSAAAASPHRCMNCRRSACARSPVQPTAGGGTRPTPAIIIWATHPKMLLAERAGFEPAVGSHLRLISSQVHSATLPPLRRGEIVAQDRRTICWRRYIPCSGSGGGCPQRTRHCSAFASASQRCIRLPLALHSTGDGRSLLPRPAVVHQPRPCVSEC
jgi:predicted DNA binding CopG/RHH family protein